MTTQTLATAPLAVSPWTPRYFEARGGGNDGRIACSMELEPGTHGVEWFSLEHRAWMTAPPSAADPSGAAPFHRPRPGAAVLLLERTASAS